MALIDYSKANNDWDARTFKPGDILDASFQYGAKIPEFFIVTRNTGKTVYAKRIGERIVTSDKYGQNGTMVPDANRVGETEHSGRITKGNYVKLCGNTAHIWSGLPVSFYTD